MKSQIILVVITMILLSPCFAAGNPVSGKEVSKQCIACHGEDGNSPTPNFPRLAGQHEDYLYHTLKAYKNGERKNAIMAGIVASLSDEDMRDVSAYFAAQDGLSSVNAENETKMMKK